MSTVQEVWPASEGGVIVVEVVVSDRDDLNTLEAVVRSFFRTEAGAMCLQLQSLSYRAFRLQCLRALAHKHTPQNSYLTPSTFEVSLGSRVTLSYSEGVVCATLRPLLFSFPDPPTSTRKRFREESLEGDPVRPHTSTPATELRR